MRKIPLRTQILGILLILICPIVNGQILSKKNVYKRCPPMFSNISGAYNKSYLIISSDSTYSLLDFFYWKKRTKTPFNEKSEAGYWKIRKDTLLLFAIGNDECKERFLIRNRKLLCIVAYHKQVKSYRRRQKVHYKLLKWKRISSAEGSFKFRI